MRKQSEMDNFGREKLREFIEALPKIEPVQMDEDQNLVGIEEVENILREKVTILETRKAEFEELMRKARASALTTPMLCCRGCKQNLCKISALEVIDGRKGVLEVKGVSDWSF